MRLQSINFRRGASRVAVVLFALWATYVVTFGPAKNDALYAVTYTFARESLSTSSSPRESCENGERYMELAAHLDAIRDGKTHLEIPKAPGHEERVLDCVKTYVAPPIKAPSWKWLAWVFAPPLVTGLTLLAAFVTLRWVTRGFKQRGE